VVGGETASPPTTDPPAEPETPSGPLPSAAPTAAPGAVAPETVAGGSLPRTGQDAAPLTAVAVALILLGGGVTVAQRRSARPRGAHSLR
jgi:LPXTG-motif cell wall-anchored protein